MPVVNIRMSPKNLGAIIPVPGAGHKGRRLT